MFSNAWLDEMVRLEIADRFGRIAEQRAFRERNKFTGVDYAPVIHEFAVIKNGTTGQYKVQFNCTPQNLEAGWLCLDHPLNAPERFPAAQRVSLTATPNPWTRA